VRALQHEAAALQQPTHSPAVTSAAVPAPSVPVAGSWRQGV